MAKVVFSAVVGDARNAVGGVVFTKSRAGAVVRRKVSPVQPRSDDQNEVRASFTTFSKIWATTLTDLQRAGWISLADANPTTDVFGNSIILTGLQMYQSLNRALSTLGVARIDNAPVNLSAGFPGALTITAVHDPGGSLTLLPSIFNAGTDGWVAFGAAAVNQGRKFIGTRLRVLDSDTAVLAAPIDLYAEYTAKFGALRAGQRVSLGLMYVNKTTGAQGTRATSSIIVA